jgi:SAM-dependent methyltransferase
VTDTVFARDLWRVRATCRLCGCPNPRKVLELAPTPPANAFCKTAEEARAQEKIPLYLARCIACGHVQLPVVVDPEVLFRNYVYVSGTSPSFVEHFSKMARVLSYGAIGVDDLVVDVGSNDGTLLRQFQEQVGCRVLGVDPAQKIAAEATASGVPTLPTFFGRELATLIREQHGAAALVTANNVFAHADSLTEIALGARDLLDDGGRFVFEVQYLVDLVEGGLFDMVYHEHLSYHHVAPLVPFFRRLHMSLVEVERVPTHGGSIRCTVRAGEHKASARVAELVAREREVLHERTWRWMDNLIHNAGVALRTLFHEAVDADQVIAGYGAPAKLTTLCHQLRADARDIAWIADDSPWKQGLYAPGTGIPIVSPTSSSGETPDIVVVFAWNFAPQIAAKLRAAGFTGRIVRPLPTLEDL